MIVAFLHMASDRAFHLSADSQLYFLVIKNKIIFYHYNEILLKWFSVHLLLWLQSQKYIFMDKHNMVYTNSGILISSKKEYPKREFPGG